MPKHPDSATIPAHPPAEPDGPAGVPQKGEVIAEKYRVEQVLGMGGMGVVLAVRHLALGELYAMKFLLPKVASNADTMARFMREARAAVRIKSEHVAQVSDVGQLPNGGLYIVMEHLDGMDLGKVLERHGALSSQTAADYVIQACAGLAEAHALGIVHRDMKPSNLFLTQRSDGSTLVKVLDFGISKAEEPGARPALTDTHQVFGSPGYMSPEQIRSAKSVDARADVWALGVILYELMTGKLPFEGDTGNALLAAISADEPQGLREARPDVPEGLANVVKQCLVKKPADRFASVAALATALAPYASAESQSLVQRVARRAAGASGSLPPPPLASYLPPPLSQPRSASSSKDAMAATERSWATTAAVRPRRRGPVIIAAAAVVAVGLGVGAFIRLRSPSANTVGVASASGPTTVTLASAAQASSSQSSGPPSGVTAVVDVHPAAIASGDRTRTDPHRDENALGRGHAQKPPAIAQTPSAVSAATAPPTPAPAPSASFGDPLGTAR